MAIAGVEATWVRGVPGEYRHGQKLITPGEDLDLPGVYLKWYDIRWEDVGVPLELVEESRALVRAEVESGRLAIAGELGFVILHRCVAAELLMVTTWRNANELWETVYRKDLASGAGFERVEFGSHKATFCVWELGAVWHESRAWSRYLASGRDEAAKRAYIEDRFTGLV